MRSKAQGSVRRGGVGRGGVCALIGRTARAAALLGCAVGIPTAALAAPLVAPGGALLAAPLSPQVVHPAEGAAAEPALKGTIRITGLGDVDRLAGALVELRQNGRLRTALSDTDGTYRIPDLRPGPAHLHVFHLAAHPVRMEVRLPSQGEMTLDLELERRTLALAPVRVEARPVTIGAVAGSVSGQSREAVVGVRALETSPGIVESGLVGALGRLPGDDEPAPDQVLYMRGSTVDARTVLLDGAPILTPFHVAGLVSPFEHDLVGDARLYLGGAPSRYGGALSYLLDVDTRNPRPDAVSGSLAADGLVLKGALEAPLPGAGAVLLAGRTIHGFQNQVEQGGRFPYGYEDLLLRWGLPLGGDHAVSFTGFRNDEHVRLDEVVLDGGQARWGNRASSFRYSGRVGRALVEGVLARSRYEASLPLEWPDPVLARASSDRRRAGLDLRIPGGEGALLLGVSADRVGFAYRLDPRVPRLEAETFILEGPARMSSTVLGGYAEVETPLTDRLDARAGLRVEHFSGEEGLRVGPRASVRLLLTDQAALTLAAGRYHQSVPRPGLSATQITEDQARLGWDPALPVASSTHLVLGLDQMLDDHLRLDVSGFVKTFDGIEPGSPARVNASGTDLRIARGGERVAGWIGYALSWFWEGEPGHRSTTFSGRHLVSAGARGWLTETLQVGLNVGYGAGLPLTSVALSTSAPDSDRVLTGAPEGFQAPTLTHLSTGTGGTAPLEPAGVDDFLRVDLEFAWALEPTVGGRSTHLRPYLRVLNALHSRDALFHYFERWRDGEMRPVAERPFLPLLGLEWRF